MRDHLILVLLFVVCLCLGSSFERWSQGWEGNRTRSGDLLAMLVGDGRKLFAQHFFIKADAYFHSGYYPSVFDNRAAFQTPHMAADAGAVEEKNTGDEDNFPGPPRDWLEAFGRKFRPAKHTHLDQGHAHAHSHGHEHHHHAVKEVELGNSPDVREILPWLRASAALDPQKIETYTTTAYWLRQRMGKVAEAEAFLRDGLSANPDSHEILFELGRIAGREPQGAGARPQLVGAGAGQVAEVRGREAGAGCLQPAANCLAPCPARRTRGPLGGMPPLSGHLEARLAATR